MIYQWAQNGDKSWVTWVTSGFGLFRSLRNGWFNAEKRGRACCKPIVNLPQATIAPKEICETAQPKKATRQIIPLMVQIVTYLSAKFSNFQSRRIPVPDIPVSPIIWPLAHLSMLLESTCSPPHDHCPSQEALTPPTPTTPWNLLVDPKNPAIHSRLTNLQQKRWPSALAYSSHYWPHRTPRFKIVSYFVDC